MREEIPISTENYRINQQIRTKEVRLIGLDGQNIGVVAIQEALNIARDAELDLVEVAPNSDPPVCRVMDFGKFIYDREKKEREARKSQVKVEVKEIRLRPKTNPYHQGFKLRDARRWLTLGIKVKVRFHFRGREITYPELVLEDMQKIANELSDVGVIEQAPSLEGRSMLMILSPVRTKGKKNPPKKVDSEEKKKDS
jgi:translation initiation factor IF-3